MHQDKDRGSKWLLERFGDTVLKLAGIRGFTSWRLSPTELVAPRRQFDGLIEVQYPNEDSTRLVVVEIVSYADGRADEQVFDDIALVHLVHRKVPDVISLILKPRGTVAGRVEKSSRSGTVHFGGSWPVVRLWEQDAESMFADGDIGLVPWIPLARSTESPERLVSRCVERIEAVPDATTRSALSAVTQILTGLAYPGVELKHLFGGVTAMIESPVLDEVREILRARYREEFLNEGLSQGLTQGLTQGLSQGKLAGLRESIRDNLAARFSAVPPGIESAIEAIHDLNRLRELHRVSAICADADEFVKKLAEIGKT